ncbi:thiol-disulfide oxidoreductase DCC family protein [Streptomyces sp. NBC_00690]|uniref:thiol-disulfide oxidoreductase DCC family protein n=1 Tax=Streptomyces sp. NBC_00690 TaxID=2975808 RepID=UPI002E2A3D9A|nr:DCC1-like thiol-disulfide oxidoreductase family protein [Streptomyces sp. NBC_00690]
MASQPRPNAPIASLTVLYDANCSLCVHLRHWLKGQPQLVPLRLVPAGSVEAQRLFPELDHARTQREITVIGDQGQIFSGSAAWIVCLWALAEHRPKAHWLATPSGAPFVRGTMLAAAKYRELSGAGPGNGSGQAACDDQCELPG